MSTTATTVYQLLLAPFFSREKPMNYCMAKVDARHVNPSKLDNGSARQHRARSYYSELTHDAEPTSLNRVVHLIDEVLHLMPAAIDVAYDVDGGGNTCSRTTPCYSTAWTSYLGDNGIFFRFSRARTALHPFGVLRSPVMGGVCFEMTDRPDSNDPRDAVTLLVFEFKKEHNANFPWVNPKDARVFDFSSFTMQPYSVGPLYCGHPNEITDEAIIDGVIITTMKIIKATVGL